MKSQPRTISDYLEAGRAFDIEKVRLLIEEVGNPLQLDTDYIPDHIRDSEAEDDWSVATLAWHLSRLAQEFRWNERIQNLPSHTEIERRTRKIADLARQLAEELVDQEGEVRQGLGPGYLFAAAAGEHESGADEVRSVAFGVQSLKKWAVIAADRAAAQKRKSPPKRGAKRDDAFHDLVNKLGGIYFYHWRARPGRSFSPMRGEHTGPFFRFIRTVVHELLPEWQGSDEALAKAIAAHSWPRG